MALKSYRLKETLKRSSKKRKKKKLFSDIVTPAVTAIVGVALVGETASAVARV